MTEPDALRICLLALRRYALQEFAAADGLDAGLVALAVHAVAVLAAVRSARGRPA